MAKTQEVAVVEETALVVQDDSDLLEADAGRDVYDLLDISIPYITILQALSPQVNKRDGKHVEGAEPGMFYDSATGQVWDGEKGLYVVNVFHSRRYSEWYPRDSKVGKGLVHNFGHDREAALKRVLDTKRFPWRTPEDTLITEAGTYYSLLMEEPGSLPTQGLISLTGTQLRKYKNLNTVAGTWRLPRKNGTLYNPIIFSRAYHMTSIPEQNDKGNWMGFKFEPGPALVKTRDSKLDANLWPGGRMIYELASEFRRQVEGGEVSVQESDAATPATDDDAPF